VASARIRGAGPFESQPVVFHWPWYWHLWRLGPWALLALAVAVPKRNRDHRALLIFVPLAILSLLWPLATKLVPSAPSASVSVDRSNLLFESLVTGLALLWLQADWLRGRPGWVRVPLSLGLMLLAGLVAFVSASQTLAGPMISILPIFVTILGAILLVALALARRMTHRRYVPLAFMVWLAGLAALLLQAQPDVRLTRLEKAILDSCERPPGMSGERGGRGIPSAVRALAALSR